MSATAGRPTVLLAMGAIWPGAGANGPVQSCLNLVDALGSDYDFRIIARDRPFDPSTPRPDTKTGVWVDRGKFNAFYVRPENFTPAYFFRLLAEVPHDLVQLNGFFDREFTIPILVGRRFAGRSRRPALLSPRGEFAPGALQISPRRFSGTRKVRGPYHFASRERQGAHVQKARGVGASRRGSPSRQCCRGHHPQSSPRA